MTTFKNLETAKEFAEIRFEELEAGETLYIMKKGRHFIVTSNYKEARNNGYELLESWYK